MPEANTLEAINIFGVPITVFKSYDHAVDSIIDRIARREKTFCVAINPEKIHRAQSDDGLKLMLNAADFHICDGIGVVIAAKTLKGKKIDRVTGVQLFFDLVARAAKEGLKVFLLGATPESNERAFQKLTEKHPGLHIVGRQDGYFKNSLAVVQRINDSGAEMLFVAMGSPKQEFWIAEHKKAINALFCMGVGGAFDVASGHAKWAPKFFRKTGTEFLYRLVTNPKRWRRQLPLLKFALMVIKEKVIYKKEPLKN